MRFRFDPFELDDQRFTLTGPDGPVHVEPQVFEVLHHLVVNHERVVSKEELLDTVWGDRFVSESALTSRIKAARQAVGDDGQAQRVIKTVHGRGYQFVAPLGDGRQPDRRGVPRLRNRIIGRQADLDAVSERLTDASLVTITGSGGIGKTSLALAVAERLHDEFVDGVVFVDLSPVPPGGDVTRALADAAALEGSASSTLDGVAAHLAARSVLLVLDNCEHVLQGSARFVDAALERGGAARILATSREPLGVAGEHVWPLGPLHGAGPALFVERARAAEPRLRWDEEDPAVVELCRRLDDVPLALELAAGQLGRFDLDELKRLLDDRLALLSSGSSSDSERHATMETAIDWSYQLLDEPEQRMLRHLSVFPSWFGITAVEALSRDLVGDTAITVFGQLVDKSLVVRSPGSGRYRLLETIRFFARDRLDEAGEAVAAFECHRRQVRDRISATSRADRWFSATLAASFRTDLEDARQAFRLSLDQGEVGDAVEVATGASFLWRNAIGCIEGSAWLDELLGRPLPPLDALWVHILRADLGQGLGDHRQMFEAAASAQQLVGETDDVAAACLAAHYGALAHLTDPDHAKDRLTGALDLARRSGEPRLVTLIEAFLAVADLADGRHDDVRSTVSRLDNAASRDGYDRFIVHWTGWMLGLSERDCGAARAWMAQQQEYLDRTGIVETWITSFSGAMCDVIEGGDVRATLRRTLDLADREGYDAGADCVLVLSYAEMCAGRFEAAAELVGTAIHGRFNATAHYVLYRAVLDQLLRQQLTPDAIDGALAAGRMRTPDEALAEFGI